MNPITEVTVPTALLLEVGITPEAVYMYVRIKAGLSAEDRAAVSFLAQRGYVEKPKEKRIFNEMTVRRKLKTFSIENQESASTFPVKWEALIFLFLQLQKEAKSCKIVEMINTHLTEMGVKTTEDWWRDQETLAKELVRLYPEWKEQDWIEALNWFLNDDFWCSVIVNVKAFTKHLDKFIVWKQKKAPKRQLTQLKVIGR